MDTPEQRYASSQDWTRLQTVITRLYLDQDKTLEEVKSYLEEHHKFFATVPMYKKKLAAWGAFKNLRFDEVLQILYLKKHRDEIQKPSTFFIRSREVDRDSLRVYLSRNPSVFAKLEAGERPNVEAIRDVTCRTPPSYSHPVTYTRLSPLPRCPSPAVRCNRLLSFPEDMFQALHDYLDQSFDTGLWSWSDSHCWNARGRNGPSGLLNSVLDRCITAGLSVSRRAEPVAVRKALDAPFAMLIRVFRNPPPILIPKVLSAAAHLNRIGRGEIRALLLQFCLDLSTAIFGQAHPLSKFWKSFVSIPHLEQYDAMERVLALCISEYNTRLGPAHPLTTEAYLKYFDAVEREKDPRTQLQSLRHQLSKINDDFADTSLLGLLKLEHALATCKLNLEQGQLNKAEDALRALAPSSLAARDESFRCVWLGYIQCLRGDIRKAEEFYRDSVLAARRTGSCDCVLESLFQLETFFLHASKPLEAERVRTERSRTFRKLDSLIWTDQTTPRPKGCDPSPTVSIIRIGSDENNTKWRPSAFAEVTEHVLASSSMP